MGEPAEESRPVSHGCTSVRTELYCIHAVQTMQSDSVLDPVDERNVPAGQFYNNTKLYHSRQD